MDVLLISIAQLLLGIFIAGGLFLVVAVCYSTVYHMRQDHESEDRSDISWNKEHDLFDTVTEFRNDFS